MSRQLECPECEATIVVDLGGGHTITAHCTGTNEEPHTAVEMEENDG